MQTINQSELPAIGAALAGGFYGGLIRVNGDLKAVVWAPKALGTTKAALLLAPLGIAQSPCDSETNTRELLESGSPAAKWVSELEINGNKEWFIPARDVLELGYRHFKPTTAENYCTWRDGENPSSVPPGWLYTEESPAQTTLEAFQAGGEEAFDPTVYRSSSLLPGGHSAFVQGFSNGIQTINHIRDEWSVRAVSLIHVIPSTL